MPIFAILLLLIKHVIAIRISLACILFIETPIIWTCIGTNISQWHYSTGNCILIRVLKDVTYVCKRHELKHHFFAENSSSHSTAHSCVKQTFKYKINNQVIDKDSLTERTLIMVLACIIMTKMVCRCSNYWHVYWLICLHLAARATWPAGL